MGAIWPGRWHWTQLSWRMGAMSLKYVGPVAGAATELQRINPHAAKIDPIERSATCNSVPWVVSCGQPAWITIAERGGVLANYQRNKHPSDTDGGLHIRRRGKRLAWTYGSSIPHVSAWRRQHGYCAISLLSSTTTGIPASPIHGFTVPTPQP